MVTGWLVLRPKDTKEDHGVILLIPVKPLKKGACSITIGREIYGDCLSGFGDEV